MNMDDLLTFLYDHIDDWPSTTEEAASHDMLAETHQKEIRGIDAYKQRFPDSTYAWPEEQNGKGDLIVDDARAQFKTARVVESKSGLQLNLSTSAGTDLNHNKLVAPYPHDAFDILIVVWEDDAGTSHFWRIPADELTKKGYLSTSEQAGIISMTVYGPEGVGPQPDPSANTPANTWTRKFYLA